MIFGAEKCLEKFEFRTNQNSLILIFRSKVVPEKNVQNFYMKMSLFFSFRKVINIAYFNSFHAKKIFHRKKFQQYEFVCHTSTG